MRPQVAHKLYLTIRAFAVLWLVGFAIGDMVYWFQEATRIANTRRALPSENEARVEGTREATRTASTRRALPTPRRQPPTANEPRTEPDSSSPVPWAGVEIPAPQAVSTAKAASFTAPAVMADHSTGELVEVAAGDIANALSQGYTLASPKQTAAFNRAVEVAVDSRERDLWWAILGLLGLGVAPLLVVVGARRWGLWLRRE